MIYTQARQSSHQPWPGYKAQSYQSALIAHLAPAPSARRWVESIPSLAWWPLFPWQAGRSERSEIKSRIHNFYPRFPSWCPKSPSSPPGGSQVGPTLHSCSNGWREINYSHLNATPSDRTGKTEVELKLRQIQALSPRKPPKRHGSVCTQKMKKWKIVQTQTGSTSSSSPVLTLERIILHEVRRVIVVNQGRDHGSAKFSGGIVLGGGGHGCQVEGFVRK